MGAPLRLEGRPAATQGHRREPVTVLPRQHPLLSSLQPLVVLVTRCVLLPWQPPPVFLRRRYNISSSSSRAGFFFLFVFFVQPESTSGRQLPLQVVGGDVSLAVADAALVDHGPIVGHLHRLADAGLAALHDAQLVGRVVHAQRRHLLPWQPLPAGQRKERWFVSIVVVVFSAL